MIIPPAFNHTPIYMSGPSNDNMISTSPVGRKHKKKPGLLPFTAPISLPQAARRATQDTSVFKRNEVSEKAAQNYSCDISNNPAQPSLRASNLYGPSGSLSNTGGMEEEEEEEDPILQDFLAGRMAQIAVDDDNDAIDTDQKMVSLLIDFTSWINLHH